jgi:cob(I)alamin adenosyltransferase
VKVYTKTGDLGLTSLGNSERTSKADLRVEAYGTLDELSAHLGLLAVQQGLEEHTRGVLQGVQQQLMRHAATVARCKDVAIDTAATAALEREIDALEAALAPLRGFVVPGGNPAAAQAHVARCVCRRAERLVVALTSRDGAASPNLLPLLNRLSDYLFVLARSLCEEKSPDAC